MQETINQGYELAKILEENPGLLREALLHMETSDREKMFTLADIEFEPENETLFDKFWNLSYNYHAKLKAENRDAEKDIKLLTTLEENSKGKKPKEIKALQKKVKDLLNPKYKNKSIEELKGLVESNINKLEEFERELDSMVTDVHGLSNYLIRLLFDIEIDTETKLADGILFRLGTIIIGEEEYKEALDLAYWNTPDDIELSMMSLNIMGECISAFYYEGSLYWHSKKLDSFYKTE